jgi:hypothetical protein
MIFELAYFIIITLSISHIWSFSEVFLPFRKIVSKIPYIKKPLLCPECCSFWVGFLFSFLYNPIILNYNFYYITNVIAGICVYFFAHYIFKQKTNKINFIN